MTKMGGGGVVRSRAAASAATAAAGAGALGRGVGRGGRGGGFGGKGRGGDSRCVCLLSWWLCVGVGVGERGLCAVSVTPPLPFSANVTCSRIATTTATTTTTTTTTPPIMTIMTVMTMMTVTITRAQGKQKCCPSHPRPPQCAPRTRENTTQLDDLSINGLSTLSFWCVLHAVHVHTAVSSKVSAPVPCPSPPFSPLHFSLLCSAF